MLNSKCFKTNKTKPFAETYLGQYYATLMSIHTPPINVFVTQHVAALQSVEVSTMSSFGDVVVVVGVVVVIECHLSMLTQFSLSSLLSSAVGRSTGGCSCCCFRSTSHRHFLAGSRSDSVSSLSSSSSVSVDARARRWPDGESLTEGIRTQGNNGGGSRTNGGEGSRTGGSFNHLCSKHSAAVIRSLSTASHHMHHFNMSTENTNRL